MIAPKGPPSAEGGFSLLETIISVALLSIVVAGTMAAFGGIASVTQPDPQREAAQRLMQRMLTLESAALKYTDPATVSINASPWRTTMPLPNGTAVPVTVAAVDSMQNGVPAIALSITYPRGASTATLSKTLPLVQQAPPPKAVIMAPGTHADPAATATP